MRWFTTEEICEILSRFEKVIIIGDSMMRHVIGSLNVMVRKDLGYGAVTDWNFNPQERYECLLIWENSIDIESRSNGGLTMLYNRQDCFCNYQFNVKACSIQGIFKTSDVMLHDLESMACAPNTIDLMSTTFGPPHFALLTLFS